MSWPSRCPLTTNVGADLFSLLWPAPGTSGVLSPTEPVPPPHSTTRSATAGSPAAGANGAAHPSWPNAPGLVRFKRDTALGSAWSSGPSWMKTRLPVGGASPGWSSTKRNAAAPAALTWAYFWSRCSGRPPAGRRSSPARSCLGSHRRRGSRPPPARSRGQAPRLPGRTRRVGQRQARVGAAAGAVRLRLAFPRSQAVKGNRSSRTSLRPISATSRPPSPPRGGSRRCPQSGRCTPGKAAPGCACGIAGPYLAADGAVEC